jgi:hypothetical protein
MLNQKESVYQATVAIAGEAGLTNTKAIDLPKEVRQQIVEAVTQSIIIGETEFSAEAHEKHNTVEAVRKYVIGLVNNWFRKDIRLNGGTKYVAKNPGCRTGITDPQIQELKKLLQLHPQAADQINAAIEARKVELGAVKKDIVIDASKIPESLRGLLVKQTEEVPPEEVESIAVES